MALQSTLRTCWLVAQHKADMHFVSGGGNGFLRRRKVKRLFKLGGYKSEASTFGKVPSNSRYFLVTVTPSLLGCCCSCRMLWRAHDGGSPAAGPAELLHTALAAESAPSVYSMGARRGHSTPRQDTAKKIISRVTSCISKLIPSFLSFCLTSGLGACKAQTGQG